jgi:hypothetical protein
MLGFIDQPLEKNVLSPAFRPMALIEAGRRFHCALNCTRKDRANLTATQWAMRVAIGDIHALN